MNEKDDRNFDDELMAAASNLATGVTPERDLWPGIEDAITTPARPERTVWNTVWAQAAAVVLLIGSSSGLTYLMMSDGANTVTPVGPRPALVFEPVSGSFGSQYNLGPDYQDARRDLEARLYEELHSLAPEARKDVMQNIDTIRQAIADINKALAEEPDNVLLQELLISTYREELSLMKKVDKITSAAMRRGDI